MILEPTMIRTISAVKATNPKNYRTAGHFVEQFTREHNMAAIVRPCHDNPYWPDEAHSADKQYKISRDHWSITLMFPNGSRGPISEWSSHIHPSEYRSMGVFLSTGTPMIDYNRAVPIYPYPTPGLVVSVLIADAFTLEGYTDPWDWAESIDYSDDTAMRIWKTIRDQTAALRVLLGDTFESARTAYQNDEGLVDDDDAAV